MRLNSEFLGIKVAVTYKRVATLLVGDGQGGGINPDINVVRIPQAVDLGGY